MTPTPNINRANLTANKPPDKPIFVNAKGEPFMVGEIVRADGGPFGNEVGIVTKDGERHGWCGIFFPRCPHTYYWKCGPLNVRKFKYDHEK